ncbi:glycolipid transfer protein domain-containing protein 2 [Sardina pilchardus]|uniref:glycolipid transfer protein domain-containing protein 2 n=1 Tax=Sardina pilchardus TaxID=27697 RepID=UPI002E147B19
MRQKQMKLTSMGVKGRAAVAVVFILLLLGSLWLYGNLESPWESCLKSYNQNDKVVFHRNGSLEPYTLELCPGQTFQISLLFAHLRSAPVGTDDVLLEPYLSSWDELIKFLVAMGPLVGAISNEIETKTSIIRELAKDEAERMRADGQSGLRAEGPNPDLGAYDSVRSMISAELSRGLVDFQKQTDSGCRTLLRLHRALLWLQLFLQKLGLPPEPGSDRLRSPSDLCREAYQQTLANHHSWWVRQMADLAFLALPERTFFYRLICVQNQEEATAILKKVVHAIDVMYNRTQRALDEHNMLDLP